MTSRSCSKSHSRKVNNSITSCNIQFDKFFQENTNRPSAAKSAGTVGKWGITSFTSIRSTSINGKRGSDNRSSNGTKYMKPNYSNQNNHEKDVFQSSNDDFYSEMNKPKKFFKSRGVASVIEQSRSDTRVCKFNDSNLTQDQEKDYISNQFFETNKSTENIVDPNTEISCREESKPPIVLRICKGTARLLCSEESEGDTETYKVTTTSPIPKSNIEQKFISQNVKSDDELNRISHSKSHILTSINSSNECDMRTTRSRSKHSRLNVTSATHSHNSGLSLTLRKSISDENSARISRYDIIKTENTSDCKDEISEVSVTPVQSLPTTTQELLDILSSDINPLKNKISCINDDSENAKHLNCTIKNLEIKNNTKTNSKNSNISVVHDKKICEEVNLNAKEKVKSIIISKNISSVFNKDTKEVAMKNSDQEYLSSSDDSECAHAHSELRSESQCLESSSEPSTITNKIVNKPVLSKKGSIFKTRSAGTANSNKRRALYKHKWCDSDKELKSITSESDKVDTENISCEIPANSNLVTYDEEIENTCLTRIVTYPETEINLSNELETAVTSIRCGKKVKGFYTVVKNVKKAHQIQESGEFQEFNDDIEYIMDTLRENNPNATRCLSAIRLASKCMTPAFRMHVRAHGTVAKFFKALHDATTDQSLALCTATVMFVLSQDRLAMDLDRDCLELMLSLLESDASHKNALDDCGLSHAELLKNKEKVRQLCADIQAQGHAKHLNLDNITVGQLAMETLLSLTSKRAGEWFKEELRELGGLEHIIKTITECHRHIKLVNRSHDYWNEPLLDKLRKVDRCLRVLENVTHMNEENQVYLLNYNESILVITLANLYKLCGQEIVKYPTNDSNDKSSVGAVIRECLFAVIKVLINLTHRFNTESFGGRTVGCQEGVILNSLHLILEVPQYIPEEKRFDIMMLALILLINLIEQCDNNKKILMMSKPLATIEDEQSGLDALISLFYKQEKLAGLEEQKTDAILDGKKDSEQSEDVTSSKSQEEFIEETVAKLLQKAGKHMEHTLIAAYVVLLLGYLVMDNKIYEQTVRKRLLDNKFNTMIAVLQKFFNFMNLTASNEISSCGIAATEKVIKFLKLSDARLEDSNDSSKSISEKTNVIMEHSLS